MLRDRLGLIMMLWLASVAALSATQLVMAQQGQHEGQQHGIPLDGIDESDAASPYGNVEGHCRLFALGDIHGDLSGARRALEAARLINRAGHWIGGCSTLVQTGDIVDRGHEGVRTLYFLRSLHKQARSVGGRVVQLLGNHEIMTFDANLAYASPVEAERFGGVEEYKARFWGKAEGREHGAIFKWLSTRNLIANINRTIFVHAGVIPSFASLGVNRLNLLARSQMQRGDFHSGVFSVDGPVWTRKIIGDATNGDCTDLDRSLDALGGATRMVIGHTVQSAQKIISYCEGRLLAIDIGMSRQMMSSQPGLLELLPNNDVQAYYSTRAVEQAEDTELTIPGSAEYKAQLAIEHRSP